MKRFILPYFTLLSGFCFSQAQIVMNNDPYIVITNSAYLVIDNGAASGITQTGTGGRIISEAENNRVRWNISNNTGTYVVPYYDNDNSTEIPFTVAIGTAGSSGGRIDFSTYDGPTWDNSTYMPSDVTNMNSLIGGLNNSSKVIDRFWIADASSYGTKPSATLSFTYIDAEWGAAGNTITEGNLGAQRFNTPNGNWDAYIPQGTISTGANTVVTVPAAPADFFRSWTLSDNTSPLPIELLSFEGNCSGAKVALKWSTATETNNHFFTLERSEDGINFSAIGTVNGAGTSTSRNNYSFTDNGSFASGTYYRLSQTDFDGMTKAFPPTYVAACTDPNSEISVFNQGGNDFTVMINSTVAGTYTVNIYNSLGQIITSKSIYAAEGKYKATMTLENIDDAMYFVNVTNGADKYITKKIVINQ